MRRFFASFIEIVEVTVVAVGAVILIRYFLVQPFLVSGASMEPNFSNGDYLLIDELTYRFRSPERGEVAVFHYPKDESTFFIKRIEGLPGERLQVKGGVVKVFNRDHPEGMMLKEPYLPAGLQTSGNLEVKLGDNQYFVMGDNRSYSFDSRSWGPLSAREIVGLVRLRLWPAADVRVYAALKGFVQKSEPKGE